MLAAGAGVGVVLVKACRVQQDTRARSQRARAGSTGFERMRRRWVFVWRRLWVVDEAKRPIGVVSLTNMIQVIMRVEKA